MKKKQIVWALVVVLVLAVGSFGYVYRSNKKAEQAGEEKFYQALVEIKYEDPNAAHPCLGGSVLEKYSYADLNEKSVDEIKTLILESPGDC